ncbi:MAG: DNA polymerase III subunit epsilon [Hyphomicrobiaceae bacterium]
MLREIVLDTETTGLKAQGGDRIVEIGCVELVNRIPQPINEFHVYINPERDMPREAEAVHGLSTQFLSDKALFADVADQFLNYIGDDMLIIHNAGFDIGFLNAELDRLGKPLIQSDRVLDTLALARRKHPGGQNTLDALCKRYGIDNSNRVKHGALLDSWLLAEVYLELIGERQASLSLASSVAQKTNGDPTAARRVKTKAAQRKKALPNCLTVEDIETHRVYVETLGEGAIWHQFFNDRDNQKTN